MPAAAKSAPRVGFQHNLGLSVFYISSRLQRLPRFIKETRVEGGESLSYTAWAEGEPNNAGRGEDFVAIYFYPFHGQRGKWNDFGDRNLSPRGLPMNGIMEIIPQKTTANVEPSA